MEKYSIETAKEELREVSNQLSFWMKKKRALQNFITDENERIMNIANPKAKVWELKHDPNFIKEHGRERTQEEIAEITCYSLRHVQRLLNEKETE